MATTTFPAVLAVPRRSLSRTIALYAKEAKYELINKTRIPVYALSTIAIPLMFYVLFGIVLGNASDRRDNATYMLATMGCFGTMAFAAVVFSTVIMLLLLSVGIAFGGVRLPFATAVELVGILVAGSIPFSAMGLAIGYFAKPNSAPAVVNLIYLPMSFCSGLWIPLSVLPHGLRALATILPPYHLSQLALNAVGMAPNPTPAWGHVEALLACTLLFLGLAAWGYRRDEGKLYG